MSKAQEYVTEDSLRPSVLIAGCDLAARKAIRDKFKQSGKFDVIEVDSVESALEQLKGQSFSCIFIDHLPSAKEQISLLREIYNAESDLAVAPCVMLTDHEHEPMMLEALRHGAQDYIFKDNLSSSTLSVAMAKARDVFDLKSNRNRAEQKLQHTRRMEALGQLTSGVAHDFNNLLTVILGNTRLLRRRIENNPESFSLEEADKKIESIEIAAAKGADLVRRMMIFTRQSQLSEEVADINKCVGETFELLKRTLGETISIDIIPVKDPWPISVDVHEFENALINLAVNARDAMPKGGRLTIETDNVVLDESYALSHPDVSAGPYVLIAVSDTGTGIEPDVMKRIFEPFFTTKEIGQGTGLGLSMVYGFIHQSKGHISVYSEVGHGTVFRIYLPRVRVDGDMVVSDGDNLDLDGQGTILVVEDDEDIRTMACNMLEKLGYKTIQAENGHIAFDILKMGHKNIDLVFTDIIMPGGMSGIELVLRVREYYPNVKALYTSGYTQNAIPDYQMSVGEELISKPYRREALGLKVKRILEEEKGNG